jgi:pyrroloquinoline quinone biosynthesis protein B
VSGDGKRWVLINASPDVRTQLAGFRAAHPEPGAVRGTGIRAIILVDSQIDHSAGLLSMREGEPLRLYTTRMVHEDLSNGFPVIPLLEHYCGVDWREIPVDGRRFQVDETPELAFTALPLSGKAPPYSPHRNDPHPGDNIGLLIHDLVSGRNLLYVPGLGTLDSALSRRIADSDCLLVDGTFWTEQEMIATGTGSKRAADMGHLPLDGPTGLISALADIRPPRTYLVHVNNTNPVLDETSSEFATLRRAGIQVAGDGMSLDL